MDEYTRENFVGLGQQLYTMPIEEFHKWALVQSTLCPDMLLFNTEEEIIDMFYKAFKRQKSRH